MKNTDIFTSGGYDMVVAVTQKSINDQIAHLANPDIGTINTNLIIDMTFGDDGETMYPHVYKDWADVDQNSKGIPSNPAINGEFMPSINISGSGTSVEFTLTFLSGKAYMRNPVSGNMLPGKDMTGWVYAIDIDLDFAGISRDDLKKGVAVPSNVLQQLDDFTTDQFSVSSLLVDFNSTDLMRFNPVSTKAPNAGDSGQAFFAVFMAQYLKAVATDPTNNPFILGYAITNTPQTVPTKDNELDTIPDSMKPVGNTFTVFEDPTNPDMSTVNFILNTKLSGGKHGSGIQETTPGTFDTNWIAADEQCNGKMVYSGFCFLETIILEPFYNAFAQSTQDQVRQCLTLPSAPNSYWQARSTPENGSGLHFEAFSQTGTNDDYTNNYDVAWNTSSSGAVISINGTLYIKKTMSKDMLVCTAVAWKSNTVNWSTTINIQYGYDKVEDKPSITVSNPQVRITGTSSNSDKNGCADKWGTIGEIFGSFLDFFTAFQDGGFLGKLFSDTTGIGQFTMPAMNLALGTVSTASKNSFMLPAGDVFFFQDLSILPEGPTSMGITYKTATDGLQMTNGSGHGPKHSSKSPKYHDARAIDTEWSRKLALRAPPKASKPPPKVSGSHKFPSQPKPGNDHCTNGSNATKPPKPGALGDSEVDQVDYSMPLSDRVSLAPISTSEIKDPIDVQISCELMQNSETGMPVAPNNDMVVIQDSNGQALIFTIGSDAKFNLLSSSSAVNSSGWTSLNMLDDFPEYANAICFDVVQAVNGSISLAVALQQQKSSQVDIFFASLLSNHLAKTDFSALASIAPLVNGIDPAFVAESIRLGSSDDTKRPTLTVEGSLNSKHLLFQLDAADTVAKLLKLPEDMTPGQNNLISHCTGFNFGQRGNYFLYNIGDTRHLIVRTFGSQGTLNYDYSPGNSSLPTQFQHLTYNCIQTATSRTGATFTASDLYIGSPNGVYRIPNGKSGSMELVTNSVADVHDITITMNGNDISLWVTASPDRLYYIYGQRTSSTAVTWNMPIIFANGVLRAAAMRNIVNSSNELFVLGQDLAVTRYWQDPDSTIWRSSKTIVKEDAYVIQSDSYTTHIHFESLGLPQPGQKVKVTSSEWQYCTINGLKYSLDQDTPAEIDVDPQGNVTIITSAVDISPPILHLQSDDFAETINIYTSGKVITNLQHFTDGASLQDAKSQDGTPVIASDVTSDVADAVATNMKTLTGAASAQYPPALSGNTFIVVEKPVSGLKSSSRQSVKHSLNAKMPTHHLPKDFTVGMHLKGGKWVKHTPASAKAHMATLSRVGISWDDVTKTAGDIWHHLENIGEKIITGLKDTAVFLSDGISFIIQLAGDVLQFVLTIGETVLEIALETFVLVFKALSWVLSLVGIDLPAILKWLGHFMGWDNVWDTHKLLATTLTNCINYADGVAPEYLEKARQSAKDFFQNMDQDIKAALLPKDIQTQTPKAATTAAAPAAPDMNSPQSNFAVYHLNNTDAATSDSTKNDTPGIQAKMANGVTHGINGSADSVKHTRFKTTKKGLKDSDTSQVYVGNIAVDALQSFATDIIEPLGKTLMDKLGTDLDDVIQLLKHGSMDNLHVLIADAADTVISVIADFVDGFLHFMEDVLTDLKDLLTQPLNMPFFSALYKFVCELMGQDEPFTGVNAVCFLVSIPLTTIMKIGGWGTLMDHNKDVGMDAVDFPQNLVAEVQAATSPPKSPMLKSKAVKGTHLLGAGAASSFEPPLGLKYFSATQGCVNGISTILYNSFDLGFLFPLATEREISKKKLWLAIIRLFSSAPMPKQNVDAQAYLVRWTAWAIGNFWRLFVLSLPNLPNYRLVNGVRTFNIAPIPLPRFFKEGGNLAVNVAQEIMAVVCDDRDNVKLITWIADMVSNSGSCFSTLGKLLDSDLGQAEVGKTMKYIATVVALMGNVTSTVAAGGTYVSIAENRDVWNGILA